MEEEKQLYICGVNLIIIGRYGHITEKNKTGWESVD
jgi:hypothetical protein